GRARRWRREWPVLALLAAALMPIILSLLRVSTGAILVINPAGGFALHLAGVLLLSLPLYLLLIRVRRPSASRLSGGALVTLGTVVSALLGVVVGMQSGPEAPTLLWSVLWGLPFVLYARAIPQ